MRPLECPDTSALKGKIKQKPLEVEEAREGKPHNRVKQAPPWPWAHHSQTVAATTGRGAHWWWWPSFVAPLRFGVLRCFALGHGFLPFLGYFGPLLAIIF